MKRPHVFPAVAAAVALAFSLSADVTGWLSWRGPTQDSISAETGLPIRLEAKSALWTAALPGQSTPVIADGRLYINGIIGAGDSLQEAIACFDAETGKLLWEDRENDFLSDIIYRRYSTSAPTVDPETGNIYVQGTQGMFKAYTRDGKRLWTHSLMEEFGRMTFPNGRTASPFVDAELVITRCITAAWGAYGPPGDRFYAFDKKTGELIWQSSPVDRPQDPSFSQPILDWWGGRRVLFAAGGDSSIFSMDVRTGQPLWRFTFAKAGAKGGVNAAVVRRGDRLIAVHESENIDSSEIGRLASFRIPTPDEVKPTNNAVAQVFETRALEAWRQPAVGSLASSPVVVGDVIYEVTGTGDLAAVDLATGRLLWKKKLGIEQRQSTPFYADGYLYVAMYIAADTVEAAAQGAGDSGGNGDLFVLKPSREGCEEISKVRLEGRCFGSPIGYNGKLYVQTDKKLYCFGKAGTNPGLAKQPTPATWPKPGPAAALQAIPFEVLLTPGEARPLRIRLVDSKGLVVQDNVDPKSVKWEVFIPPTALVKSTLSGTFDAEGRLVADKVAVPSAGVFKGTYTTTEGKPIIGFVKGRVLTGVPVTMDFENFELTNTTTNTMEAPTAFAYPPLPWNACRFKFEVRNQDMDGKPNKALVKTIDNKLLQRGLVFFGPDSMSNYTVQADVLSEGNRRKMSEIGLVNQRYAVILKGNSQEIEINSNLERFRRSSPFKWLPNTWYTLKVRVDLQSDGSGIVRAKAWKRGDPEPAAWTAEVPDMLAHRQGSPGFFGFSPQEQRVAIDNIMVTPN